jgi:DNA gyrase subunit B
VDFLQTGEFRTLLHSYQDVRGFTGPMTVVAGSASVDEPDPEVEAESAGVDGTAVGGATIDDLTRLAAEPRPEQKPHRKGEPAEVRVQSLDELVELFINAGKKGVAVNRYKGLGEMNPDTLWQTTMDPAVRTLLQVRAEDHTEADLMFTTLMGDQVEPRRKFIEDNALDVKNLDV